MHFILLKILLCQLVQDRKCGFKPTHVVAFLLLADVAVLAKVVVLSEEAYEVLKVHEQVPCKMLAIPLQKIITDLELPRVLDPLEDVLQGQLHAALDFGVELPANHLRPLGLLIALVQFQELVEVVALHKNGLDARSGLGEREVAVVRLEDDKVMLENLMRRFARVRHSECGGHVE